MPTHIKYPSIEQFRNVIKYVKMKASYKGKDADGNSVYDNSVPLPVLSFHGSVKLHGTNAAVCQDKEGIIWAQSRERILTEAADNCGFWRFTEDNEAYFKGLFSAIRHYMAGDSESTIAIYGEYAGQGIQSGVAISQVPKAFYVFAIALVNGEHKIWFQPPIIKMFFDDPWHDTYPTPTNVCCLHDFFTKELDIDFSKPEMIQNELIAITEQVERVCPVGSALGIEGTGEGVVWRCVTPGWSNDSQTWFKVKGEKHSVSRVKTLASIDVEKVNSIKECVEKIVTDRRLEQGMSHLKESNLEFDIKNMGVFLKWLASDAIKEESDTILGSGLVPKEVGKAISDKGRKWFMSKLT